MVDVLNNQVVPFPNKDTFFVCSFQLHRPSFYVRAHKARIYLRVWKKVSIFV